MSRVPSPYRVVLAEVLDELAYRFAQAQQDEDPGVIQATGAILGTAFSISEKAGYAKKAIRADMLESLAQFDIPLVAAELNYNLAEVRR